MIKESKRNSQDYRVFGLCPLSGILKNTETQRFGNCVLLFFRIPDDGQSTKPSSPECHIPSSKPFKVQE
jgi:hypothetical protein